MIAVTVGKPGDGMRLSEREPKRYFCEVKGAGVHWFRTLELATAFGLRMQRMGFDCVCGARCV